MMDFLYFPQDKTEYIPAVLSLLVFVAFAVLAMYFIVKVSKKQEERTEEQFGNGEEENKPYSG